jgi:hypothetical protein
MAKKKEEKVVDINSDVKQDIRNEQTIIGQIANAINAIDAQREKAVAELNAHSGVVRFLLEKLPEEERVEFTGQPVVEETPEKDS